MNCKEATIWLLHADDRAVPPDDVAAHLQSCRRCRRRAARLRRLDWAIRRLPPPSDNPARRSEVLARFGAEPASRAAAPQALVPRRRWRVVLARAAMILLLIGGVGVLALQMGDSDPADVRPQPDPTVDVVARVVDRHLQLAEGLPPQERFRVVAGLAADLGREGVRLARLPAGKELARVTRLYEQVVNEGLVPRAGRLPAEHQRRLVQGVMAELRQTETDAEQAAGTATPENAVTLRALAASAERARTRLAALLGEALP